MQFYALIGIFEVALRNSIDRHYLNLFGFDWLKNAIKPGGRFAASHGCEGTIEPIIRGCGRLTNNYSHDKLVAELNFGFWVYQFAAKEFAAMGSSLLQILPNRPFGTNHKRVFRELVKINHFRNRIAHHESICFEGNVISIEQAVRRYCSIMKVGLWLGFDPNKIYGDI